MIVEISDELAHLFPSEDGDGSLARRAQEALVVEAVREGRVSRGYAREVLGMTLEDSEALFASRGVKYDLTAAELDRQLSDSNALRLGS